MTGVRYRLRGTPRRACLAYAGYFAIFVGIDKAVEGKSFWYALSYGVVAGVLFAGGMAMVARNRPEAVRELPDGDRQTVVRTVHEGATVEDARLAPAIIAYATYRRQEREQPWTRPGVERMFCGILALGIGYLALTSGLDGRRAAALWNAALAAILVVMVFVLPRKRERELQRADQAERSARTFLDRQREPPAAAC